MLPDEITMKEADYWQHKHNVWFGYLQTFDMCCSYILSDDLKDLLPLSCFLTDVKDLLHCTEKEFRFSENYGKRHDSQFKQWMHSFHLTAYFHPVVCACVTLSKIYMLREHQQY